MPSHHATPRWTRHFVYRAERTRTTWKFRFGLLVLLGGALWTTRGWWTVALASSLVCDANRAPSDAILVENFNVEYLVFERAAELRQASLAPRVLVPLWSDPASSEVDEVALRTAEVMAGVARLGTFDRVPIDRKEPISLDAALDVRRFLERERIRSVIVVSPLFRSRRSALVYGATLRPAGITVTCQPSRGPVTVETSAHSWHGVQDVAEQ